MDIMLNYHSLLVAMFCAGLILFVQFIVADLAGFFDKKHPGHPVPPDHDEFLWRAIRAYSNMNESVVVFVLFAGVGLLIKADPVWLTRWAWVYVATRAFYGVCYWANLKLSRSIAFGVSLFALLAMGIVVALALF